MDELSRFIAETPLWLVIIFFAVFAAMSVTFVVLLVRALRRYKGLTPSPSPKGEGNIWGEGSE